MALSTFVSHEASARLIAFATILGVLIFWERWAAAHTARISLGHRWSTNFGMGMLDTLILRLIFPAGAVGAAMLAARQHMGIFNHLSLTGAGAIAATLILLDLSIYLQHRLFHVFPWLWRVHRVHHADPEVDVSTALRFHPLESLLSMLLKTGVVICFGMPPLGVLAFEIVLNAAAMFNHANASLPPRLERCVRLVLVTQDMHRIHHSIRVVDANRNFGFCVSWWDRLFRSYCAPDQNRSSLQGSIGLPDAPAASEHLRLPWLLSMPFRR
jgi:sterol desaturase/sphingolipid hydroxylase (fatty acid hydroxylase superfamily)